MQKPNLLTPKTLLVGAILGLLTVLMIGCSGADTTPTNTKNSQYIGSGDTAADKMGQQRARARLPHGGQAPQ